jgi:Uma2 family endonuclease
MATAHRVRLGPEDHGRPISFEDFQIADTAEGYRYELIDGKIYVAAVPNPPHARLGKWLYDELSRYSSLRPDIINYVYFNAAVFVPGRKGVTCPQPDMSAYRDYPLRAPFNAVRWQEISPLLVAEVLSPDNVAKDLVRNVELYWQVPSIKEYWIVDGLPDAELPTLHVHRRGRKEWRVIEVPFGETYTTKLLPGFELIVDPRR